MCCCTDWPAEQDPELHDFYARKLLEPGWAGELTDIEATYIAEKLMQSASLRRRWRVRETTHRRRITPEMVERLATRWAGMPNAATEGPLPDTPEKYDDARAM